MKKLILLVIPAMLLLAALLYPGSGRRVGLRLYAGAALRRAVEKLTAAFEAETGIRVEADYGGSGMILSRAREDKTADLFLPGDEWYVDQLQEFTGHVARRAPVARFVPTIIVAKGNPLHVKGLADFARDDLRIAVGKTDACQIGRVSARILSNAGVDLAARKPRESLTVNELGVWVKMKAVDAAIVWDAIAANIAEDVETIPIPPGQNRISNVVLATLTTSPHPEAAARFLRFVQGETGQRILRETGYRTVAARAASSPVRKSP